MKHLLLTTIAAVVLVGCGGPMDSSVKEQLLIWGNKGDGIRIENDRKTMVRKANNEKPYCGALSEYPVPPDRLITLKINSSSERMFFYIGLTSNNIEVNKWTNNRPKNLCLYFSDGKKWSGIHDSQYAKMNNSRDWRDSVVPVVKESETISLIYSPSIKKITFYKDDNNVYEGHGFEGDLHLFAAVRYPEEKITILE